MRLSIILSAILLPSLLVMAQAPKPTPEKAEKLVKAAINFAKQNSLDRLIIETNSADGRFHVGTGGELYIFIYDQEGNCKAIGFNTAMYVGENRFSLKDSDGKLFLQEIIKTAKSKGSGWVDYKYLNPTSNKVEDKTSYVESFNGVVVGAGVYKQ